MYHIPLFDLNFDFKEENAVMDVLKSRWISSGPRTIEFEESFSKLLDVKYSVALSNCTVALHLALYLVGIEKDDEVICPSLTFVATVNAIKYLNATPIFADINSINNPTISHQHIESLITSKTKAIIVMHFGGFACDMDSIMLLAKKYNLRVIEDACHAPLSEYKGKKLGTIADIGCFSFFSNKNISTGEGGMLITNNEEYYQRAKLLRSHGMTSMSYDRAKGHSVDYDVVETGFNYRMDDLRAAIGIVQLEKLNNDLKLRSEKRKLYLELLGNCSQIEIPFSENKEFVSNYIMPIVLKESTFQRRDEVRRELASKGIQTSVHYPAVHRFSNYNDKKVVLPITEYFSDNVITLPMYSNLDSESINYITKNILSLL